jgi:hypothetical protein
MPAVSEQELSAMEASVRTIRTLRPAAAATIAAAAVTATLALPAHAAPPMFSGYGYGTGATLAAAEQAALQDLRGNFSGCTGPIVYYDEGFTDGFYYVSVAQSPCKEAN